MGTNIRQHTQEWNRVRKCRATASNVGAIFGLNLWRKQVDVLRAMAREHHSLTGE